jgi:hypothetical protein
LRDEQSGFPELLLQTVNLKIFLCNNPTVGGEILGNQSIAMETHQLYSKAQNCQLAEPVLSNTNGKHQPRAAEPVLSILNRLMLKRRSRSINHYHQVQTFG